MKQKSSSNKTIKKNKRSHCIHACLLCVFCLLCGIFLWPYFIPHEECDFYRNGRCVTCLTEQDFPVGYRENCAKCPNKKAHYVEGGLVAAWLCLADTTDTESLDDDLHIESDKSPCPSDYPIKDVVGNCYSCDSEEIIRTFSSSFKVDDCARYFLPDQLAFKSLKCPILEDIHDPEVCFSCHGIWAGEACSDKGENIFCEENKDCPEDQWCFPLKMAQKQKGLCTNKSETQWICSQTDGYDLETARQFCARQQAHIPSLEEIEQANENLAELCPTLDMWTFFAPDGTVWLESFTQEFLFTREGETEKLGGHHFYALCHKD